MSRRRQKNQLKLPLTLDQRGEAPRSPSEGAELLVAGRDTEGPASPQRLMEEVCEAENLKKALKRVKANKGSPGIDGMAVGQLPGYLKQHWPIIREQMLSGSYKPQPVRRVEIPKPDGGVRKLGIPTVLDRFVQQAVMQVLQDIWDPTFSEHSYGFRPQRSAHQAVIQAKQHIAEGHRWVVDLDLERFFDRVNHDMLMGRIAKRVEDKRVLKLIRAYLNAGVMEDGLVSPTREGTPQGGPLSPLLSNIVLDDLDRELERRGHRFVRYADDCNIYLRTERAGQRVKDSITRFITGKLKLKVNEAKSAVAQPQRRKFLGFSFTGQKRPRIRIAPQALQRFRKRVRELTRRTRGVSIEQTVKDLSPYVRGWAEYFRLCETPSVLESLDSWIRCRLRALVWRHWGNGPRRYQQVRRLGVCKQQAAAARSDRGPTRMSRSVVMCMAMPETYFRKLGLPSINVREDA